MTESLHNIETTQHSIYFLAAVLPFPRFSSCLSGYLLLQLSPDCWVTLCSSFLGDLNFGPLIFLQCISPDIIPGDFHIHICGPPNTMSNSTLPQLLIPIHIPDLCTSYCNSSLSYDHLTLQLRSRIIPVHFLQYSNSENDHAPLQSESIPSPSCPWSSTLLQTFGNSLSLILLLWNWLEETPK